MARIAINIHQKSPRSPIHLDLWADHGSRDTIAESRLLDELVDRLQADWQSFAAPVRPQFRVRTSGDESHRAAESVALAALAEGNG